MERDFGRNEKEMQNMKCSASVGKEYSDSSWKSDAKKKKRNYSFPYFS